MYAHLRVSSGKVFHGAKWISYRCEISSGYGTFMKDVSGSFPTAYNSDDVEAGWYNWWLNQKCFQQAQMNVANRADKRFSMVLPPPNVTGDLHLGHALAVTIQDALIRWHKANGKISLWIPGYDHAGIATQVVVEKKIKAQTGRLRHQLNKMEFVREANAWKDIKIDYIRRQLQRLGSSLDWSRECFTMDKDFASAVEEAFVRLHDEGLIKREKALVNWCCYLQSAISDIEVDNISIPPDSTYLVPGYDKPLQVGKLTLFAYRLANSQNNEELIVATTRPETIFGDAAVAVHPADQRYSQWFGQQVCHPLTGQRLPIIADESVDSKFGTGCVKITPAHDYRDFELARRHNLPCISIMDKKGNITATVGKFQGMSRFEARSAVIEELKILGLFRGQQNHESSLPICSRSGDIIEPLLYPQWYLDCSKMYSELVQDIESGRLEIDPSFAKKILLHWLSEKRKWCISRQLWWGHQIPAYYIKDSKNADDEENSDNWIVGRTVDEAIKKASQKLGRQLNADCLIRDEDVLDTWFSSALFPFAALGWPKKDPDFLINDFYPLSLMETGDDIIFFWVARMAILGKKLTGLLPFNKVLVHGLICDAYGRKMSKSLGNVIDPADVLQGANLQDLYRRSDKLFADGYISKQELDTTKKVLAQDFPSGIPKCGADALRFALLSQDVKSQHINVDISYMHSCSKFCNKVWQACKFFLIVLEKANAEVKPLAQVHLSPIDKWILSRLYTMTEQCNSCFETYDFHLVTKALRNFWHASLCDIYLEGIKPVLYNDDVAVAQKEAAVSTLYACIRTATIALAPVMPFVTEELYHRLKLSSIGISSISEEPYPTPEQWRTWNNPQLEETFAGAIAIAAELRQILVDYEISKAKSEVLLVIKDSECAAMLEQIRHQIEAMSRCGGVKIVQELPSVPYSITRSVSSGITVTVKVEGVINSESIIQRMQQRQSKLEKELTRSLKAVEKPNYRTIFTANAQQKHADKIATLKEDLLQIGRRICEVETLIPVSKK